MVDICQNLSKITFKDDYSRVPIIRLEFLWPTSLITEISLNLNSSIILPPSCRVAWVYTVGTSNNLISESSKEFLTAFLEMKHCMMCLFIKPKWNDFRGRRDVIFIFQVKPALGYSPTQYGHSVLMLCILTKRRILFCL